MGKCCTVVCMVLLVFILTLSIFIFFSLFGEWCVDCPHVTDVVSEAQAIDAGADSQQIGEITGGCGKGTIGADVCVKPVLRNGELDYIAHCPTGSSRVEVLPGKRSEAYDVNRIYEHGILGITLRSGGHFW